MSWNLDESSKAKYFSLLKNAQALETSIGSMQYRLHKMLNMRDDLDKELRAFWETTLTSLSLDPKKDYFVDNDGIVKEVPQKTSALTPDATTVAETLTVEDLK